MYSKRFQGVILVITICTLFTIIAFKTINQNPAQKTSASDQIQYILDAGHGTPDGGTVGSDGTTEAALNIAITKKISNNLSAAKISHLLTRSDEESIYSEGDTIHEKKVSDIRNRISIADRTPTTPLISIHMNSYPDNSVYGIQVFYGNGEVAQNLAADLQTTINDELQPNHNKVAKQVSKNIYLFSHISNPVILIECGFLSNNDDLSKLKSDEYQAKLANAITKVLAAHY